MGRTQPSSDSARRDAGQSEVVGVMLFTGVVVVAVSLVAMFVLSAFQPEPEPAADVEVEVGSSALEVAHDGGDVFQTADVAVVLADGDDARLGLENFTEVAGNGDDRFEPGEVRSHGHGAAETLTVRVVHGPTNTVLTADSVDVP